MPANTTFLRLAVVLAATAALPAIAFADASSEIVTAAMHADLAAKGADVTTVHTHLHHTLNCLVGPGGTGFDATQMNPCAQSGHGAIPDSKDAATKQKLEAAAITARDGIAATDVPAAQKAASDTATTLKQIK